ncbi:MAG: flagellar M-ring protein FliF [Deltaproteobacteria bacterium]|nr:flagellar M-ring protein FliF [Deltaproteobacteria bacterium]
MNEKITNLKEQSLKIWKEMPTSKRYLSIALILGVVAFAAYLIFHEEKVDYAYLFTDLDPVSGGKIVEELRDRNIPYKVTGGGSTIMVPKEKVYDLRLHMATKGLTLGSNATGFEIFDKSQFGVTDFVQKLNFRRALEGELARTISSLNSVKSARVHLVIPERRLFKDDKEDASASVVLSVANSRSLSRRNIDGIRNLVAGSVPGLKPAHVNIVDSNGEVISDSDSESTEKMSMINIQKRLEKDYERKISNMLEEILGKGKAVVRVSLELDFTKKSSVLEKYNPDGQVPRSEKKHVERRGNVAAATKGIPGARSNLPGGAQPRQNGTRAGAETVKTMTNYEIDKTVTKVVDPTGTRKRISVAVVVDGSYKKDPKGAVVFSPLSGKKLASIAELVKKAVGFRPQAGDQVEIQSYELSKPVKVLPPKAQGKSYIKYVPYAAGIGTGILILAMFIFMYLLPKYKVWKQMKVREAAILSEIQDNRFKPTPIKIIEEKLEAPAIEGQKILIDSSRENEVNPAESQRDQVLQFVESDPDRTVAILKNWITAEI